MSDFKQILSKAKRQVRISVQEVRDKLNPDPNGFTLLDVREGGEWEQGHLDKAIFLPRGFLEVKADKKPCLKESSHRCLLRWRDPVGARC